MLFHNREYDDIMLKTLVVGLYNQWEEIKSRKDYNVVLVFVKHLLSLAIFDF